MYKISVPIMNSSLKHQDREAVLTEIRRFGAARVILALDRYELDPTARHTVMTELKDNCRFFKEQGYEVGAWIWTFWIKGNREFRCMRSLSGQDITEFMCPSDPQFLRFACDYIAEVAACGVDIIQFDDDFRYAFLADEPACLCEGHIAAINRLTGETSTREELEVYIKTGGKNKFRDAYLQANGDIFRRFASEVRLAVDSVNPAIRMGACACMSSWDIDGVSAAELSHILAGKTAPFVRLIGAPYWAVEKSWGNSLQDVVELERMESAWTRDGEIEIMAEGDAFPRPRTRCPASYLEGFDTAIRASGATDGILKYGIDYYSTPGYEQGYAVFHERNIPLYREIDRHFGEKTPCGVRVYEFARKVADAVTPTAVNARVDIADLFFSRAARTLAYNSIPTVYEGEGVTGICFDENARHLPLSALQNGLILDIAAAEILTARGVDVGLSGIGAATQAGFERFPTDGNLLFGDSATVYRITLKEGAEVLSEAETPVGRLPFSYRYENASGNRFLVLNINTRERDNLLKHYARSRQYAENIPWLSGHRLPAHVEGSPALYLLCKKDASGNMAVGLWNFFADPVLAPTVQLDTAYSSADFLACEGKLDGAQVTLTDIPPFGFVGISLTK